MADKTMLVRQIHAIDFALLEMNLYLDTHPADECALKTFQIYKEKRAEKIMEYESRFGPYIVTAPDCQCDNYFEWINSPWPWEYGSED